MGVINFEYSGLPLSNFVLQTTKEDGSMTSKTTFNSGNISEEQMEPLFQKRAGLVCDKYGIKGIFKTLQKPGADSVRVVDEELCSHIDDEHKCISVNEQALIITDEYPQYVIGHAVADCPVVMLFDYTRGIIATAHCSGAKVDKGIINELVDGICNYGGSSKQDLLAYVSMGAGPEWTYDCWPKWASNIAIWNPTRNIQFIKEKEDGNYRIDIKSAISYQLERAKLDKSNIIVSQESTIGLDSEYYSNHDCRKYGEPPGLNFAGAGFNLEESHDYQKSMTLSYRR